MECKDIREIISAYVDGEASPEEVREIRGHLGACAQCRSAEQQMRAIGIGVAGIEGDIPHEFRDRLFARMEKEDLLPKRRSIFVFSLRWAAVPLAAAAALAFYVMFPREIPREFSSPAVRPPQVAAPAGTLSPEDREIVANLDILEDPELLDEPPVDEMEIFVPSSRQQG
jgi:anti-sigma factor RsiW